MPRVRAISRDDAVAATPTSEPWIDSNTWLVRLLAERCGFPVWLGYSLEHPSPDDYVRAIADTAAAGGRWVITPDLDLMAGLARGDAGAGQTWRRIAEALRFFEQQDGWRRFECRGPLGIVYEPARADGLVFTESLNLIARRRIPYRLIARPALRAPLLAGLKAVLATVLDPPSPRERSLLESFAARGGLVIYKTSGADPETLSKDLLSLIGRGNLGVRLFNASSVLPTTGVADSGNRLLVQLINYASMPSGTVTVRVGGDYRAATLFCPGRPKEALAIEPAAGGVQVAIKEVSVYAAVLLEK